nr:DMT family transporter [Aliidongia dinghuensis]
MPAAPASPGRSSRRSPRPAAPSRVPATSAPACRPLPCSAGGAAIGAVASAGWAVLTGRPLVLDLSAHYLASLIYLAIAASCGAFMLYFELVRRLGPGRAAYTLATVPVVALVLSTLFENLQLDGRIVLGAAAVLAGNILVLRR